MLVSRKNRRQRTFNRRPAKASLRLKICSSKYPLLDWRRVRVCSEGALHGILWNQKTIAHAHVSWNSHFGNIQTFDLRLRICTEADDQIDRLKHDESEDPDRNDVRSNTNAFRQELRSIAI